MAMQVVVATPQHARGGPPGRAAAAAGRAAAAAAAAAATDLDLRYLDIIFKLAACRHRHDNQQFEAGVGPPKFAVYWSEAGAGDQVDLGHG